MDRPKYNQEQVKLVFEILKKDHFIDKNELLAKAKEVIGYRTITKPHEKSKGMTFRNIAVISSSQNFSMNSSDVPGNLINQCIGSNDFKNVAI